MRWARAGVSASFRVDEIAGSVRQSRVVLTPRPWRQACEKYLAGDGGNKRRFTGASTKEPVKPSRGESRNVSAEPVVTMLVCFFILQTRLRVQLAPGFPCALSLERDDEMQNSGK